MDFFLNIFKPSSVNRLDPAQVQSLLAKSPKPYLLDVRTSDEYKQGHISGAELIPLDNLDSKIGRIPKGREIICICASGSRSSTAARRLSGEGYQVSNMKSGMNGWVRAGLPVKKGLAK